MKLSKKKGGIVWLASYPKSGNTWFRIFLEALILQKDNPIDINNLQHSKNANSRYTFEEISGVCSSELTNYEIDILRPIVYAYMAKESKSLSFLKVHDAWRKNVIGQSLFPREATNGVLYIIRNPLDVAVSLSYHASQSTAEMIDGLNNINNTYSFNPEKYFTQFQQVIYDWSGHVKSWVDLSGLPVHVIRYEDMLDDEIRSFSDAVHFLGLSCSEEEIINAIKRSTFTTLKEQEKARGFKEKPIEMKSFFRTGKHNNWSEYLSNIEVSRIVNKHAEVMKRFGYLD